LLLVSPGSCQKRGLKWFEFGHLNRGDMLTSEQHRCHNEKRNFSAEFKRESAQLVVDQNYTVADAASARMSAFPQGDG
jgi:hypothetical protein